VNVELDTTDSIAANLLLAYIKYIPDPLIISPDHVDELKKIFRLN